MKVDLNNIKDGLISGLKIKRAITARNRTYLTESINKKLVDDYVKEGWKIDVEFKTKTRLKKDKTIDVLFEDYVWAIMARLGFEEMNADRNFHLPYSDGQMTSKQIDVFAVDSEAILIIECKATSTIKRSNFKNDIEAIGGRKEGIIKTIKKLYPHAKHKIKFVLATKNYYLSAPDEERLKHFDIIHFGDEMLDYYNELTKHLGHSARYQLLGNLFHGQTIPEMENKIPAIEGRMGGHVYYSFSIEPSKLLKIGYVLHRNKANKKLMPTYQRLIKRSRLKSVKEFVSDGGFFPNSIIINLESKRKLKFEPASGKSDSVHSRIGILHLPKKYRSAFVIDGQHRLYGYTDSQYAESNTIPVVAFQNLDRNDQVRIFMQINENQKSVPKNLRNTLNANLLWDSDNYHEQIKALKLQIAQDLGEEKDSPLFDKVIIGENKKSKTRCITIDSIKTGLDRTNFFGSFTKNEIKSIGTFYSGSNDNTYAILLPFLKTTFHFFAESLPEEWDKGDDEYGCLTINAGINSLIRLFSDIVDHLIKEKDINVRTIKSEELNELIIYYLDPVIHFYKELKFEDREDLRKSYGIAGRTRYWRLLQNQIKKMRGDFDPPGLEEYLTKEAKEYNEESFKIIRDLEIYFKEDFRSKLTEKFGKSWFKKGVPQKVYEKAGTLALAKNREIENESEEKQPWDCLNIIDYRSIATYGKNWSEIFEIYYTRSGEEKISGGKDAKTKWMQKLERIRNENFHSYSVTEEEFSFLSELKEWLLI